MAKINSSHIRSVVHDSEIGMMKVRFWNGSEYEYYSVTKKEYKEVVDARDVGNKFSQLKTTKPFFQTKHKTIGNDIVH